MSQFLTALSGTLLILAVLFGALLKWITARTALTLCAAASAINLIRAITREDWLWVLLDALATVAFTWWAVHPKPRRARP